MKRGFLEASLQLYINSIPENEKTWIVLRIETNSILRYDKLANATINWASYTHNLN